MHLLIFHLFLSLLYRETVMMSFEQRGITIFYRHQRNCTIKGCCDDYDRGDDLILISVPDWLRIVSNKIVQRPRKTRPWIMDDRTWKKLHSFYNNYLDDEQNGDDDDPDDATILC